MSIQPPLSTAEAKVVVCDFGTDNWRDALDFDPVMIPVESLDTTDVFDSNVIGLMNGLIEAEIEGSGPSGKGPMYGLVWSATGHPVKGVCPVCDDVFPVSDGAPGDELNEGYDAVCCGCDPRDND